jgi:hypothetical protein
MRRFALILAGLLALAFASTALADSPHFVKGPDYTATTSSLTATGKAAGLGNGPAQAFLTADEVSVSFHCQNNGGNFAPGHPATSENVAGPTQQITPRNGSISFSPSLSAPVPSAADQCPSRKWRVIVDSVDYIGVTLHIQQPPGTDVLTDGPNDFSA